VTGTLRSMAKNSRLKSSPSLVVLVNTIGGGLDIQRIGLVEQTVVGQRMRGSLAAGSR
jgi:hypothetical protein